VPRSSSLGWSLPIVLLFPSRAVPTRWSEGGARRYLLGVSEEQRYRIEVTYCLP